MCGAFLSFPSSIFFSPCKAFPLARVKQRRNQKRSIIFLSSIYILYYTIYTILSGHRRYSSPFSPLHLSCLLPLLFKRRQICSCFQLKKTDAPVLFTVFNMCVDMGVAKSLLLSKSHLLSKRRSNFEPPSVIISLFRRLASAC